MKSTGAARPVIPLMVGRFRVCKRGLKCSAERELGYRTFQTGLENSKASDGEREHNTDLSGSVSQAQIHVTLGCG